MATEKKTLEQLLHEKITALPAFLIVGTSQMGYHDINEGNEVYATDSKGIKKMALDEDRNVLVAGEYVVQSDASNNRIFYIPNTHKSPYTGKGAVEIELQDGDNINRAMLELFGEFVKGRFDFGVTIFATETYANVEVVEEG